MADYLVVILRDAGRIEENKKVYRNIDYDQLVTMLRHSFKSSYDTKIQIFELKFLKSYNSSEWWQEEKDRLDFELYKKLKAKFETEKEETK